MSKKQQIYELLLEEDLTVKQVSERLGFKEDLTRTSIHRLQKEDKIISIGKNGNSNIFKAKLQDSLEIQIIKKFIPIFLDNGIDIEFTDLEFSKVKEIFEGIRQNA